VVRIHPSLAEFVSGGRVLVSVNQEFAREDTPVRNGDEVGLMPPFSGGEPLVRIQREPFSITEDVDRVRSASRSVGGIVTFLGTTRDLSRGKTVSRLDFEHYPGMAERTLEEIRERALREFGVIEVSIVHRVGTIPVGEDIVLIAVSAAHRDEAFRACRFCIDELKRITPIWKRETTPDGETWVEEHP
jgi:molybdopterin synthase catalytic subunit